MPAVSDAFFLAVKRHRQPAYKLARRAGVSGPWLSQLLHGALDVDATDPRVKRLAKLVGVPLGRVFAPRPKCLKVRRRVTRRGRVSWGATSGRPRRVTKWGVQDI